MTLFKGKRHNYYYKGYLCVMGWAFELSWSLGSVEMPTLRQWRWRCFFKDNRNFNWNWILPIVKNQKMFQVVKGCQFCLRGFPELYKIIQNTRQAIFRERFFGNVQNIDSESKKDDRWKFEHFNVLSLKICTLRINKLKW